jgi:hypothetical protein
MQLNPILGCDTAQISNHERSGALPSALSKYSAARHEIAAHLSLDFRFVNSQYKANTQNPTRRKLVAATRIVFLSFLNFIVSLGSRN